METIAVVFAVITMFATSAMATDNHSGQRKGGQNRDLEGEAE